MTTTLHVRRRGPLGWALLLLAALLLNNRPAQAQSVDTYAFTASTGTFTALPATATAVTTISSDDALTGAIPIGFTFVFDGTPFTQVYASSNGTLSFNASAPMNGFDSYTNDLSAAVAGLRPMAAPFWDDLDGLNGTASYQTTGTAPNRVFTFEWLNWRQHNPNTAAQLSFQVQLVEGSNVVRFVYRPEAAALVTAGGSIGLAGIGSGSGSFLSLSNASATPAVSSTTATNNIDTVPAAGQTYTFTPPAPAACPAPRNLAATVTSTTAVRTYSVSNTTPGPFTILDGPTGFNPALPISPTNFYTLVTTTGTTYTLTGLTPQTGYQFYVVQNCGGSAGSSTRSNAGSFTTPPTAPVNDDCAGAINVPVQFGSCVTQVSADNTAATSSTGVVAPICASYQGRDVWFKVTVPGTGTVTIQTVPPSGGSVITDTGMSVYSGTCAALSLLGCDDDGAGSSAFSLLTYTGRTPGEVLYIRVWAYSNSGDGLLAVCVTSPANCAAPAGLTASNLTNTSAQLNWAAAAGSAGNTYELEYGPQGYVQGTGTSIIGLTGTSAALSGLSPNTSYCFYVRQNCGPVNGSSAFVGPVCFMTPLTVPLNDEPCGAIALRTTAITGSNVGATTSLQNGINTPTCGGGPVPKDVWYAFTASATTSTLTLTGNAAGTVRVYSSVGCTAGPFTEMFCRGSGTNNTTVGSVAVPGLTAGTRYYVAVNGFGSSDTPGTFTIAATNVLATKAQADTEALVVYPNPSNTGQLTLRLASLAGKGQATLLNALGQAVRSQALNGAAEQTISTRDLAAGFYTLRVTAGEQVLTRKVVLE